MSTRTHAPRGPSTIPTRARTPSVLHPFHGSARKKNQTEWRGDGNRIPRPPTRRGPLRALKTLRPTSPSRSRQAAAPRCLGGPPAGAFRATGITRSERHREAPPPRRRRRRRRHYHRRQQQGEDLGPNRRHRRRRRRCRCTGRHERRRCLPSLPPRSLGPCGDTSRPTRCPAPPPTSMATCRRRRRCPRAQFSSPRRCWWGSGTSSGTGSTSSSGRRGRRRTGAGRRRRAGLAGAAAAAAAVRAGPPALP